MDIIVSPQHKYTYAHTHTQAQIHIHQIFLDTNSYFGVFFIPVPLRTLGSKIVRIKCLPLYVFLSLSHTHTLPLIERHTCKHSDDPSQRDTGAILQRKKQVPAENLPR